MSSPFWLSSDLFDYEYRQKTPKAKKDPLSQHVIRERLGVKMVLVRVRDGQQVLTAGSPRGQRFVKRRGV
jgi:hypothetical protein